VRPTQPLTPDRPLDVNVHPSLTTPVTHIIPVPGGWLS